MNNNNENRYNNSNRYNNNGNNKYNNNGNNKYSRFIKTYYDIVVFDEDSRRKFFHKDLRKWEVEAIRFNPHLKVKIVDKRVIDKRDKEK